MAMKERLAISSSGWLAIVVGLACLAGSIFMFVLTAQHRMSPAPYAVGGSVLVITGLVLLMGNFVVGPNEARVLTFFGRYTGTVREAGLRWANPFTTKREVSLRARNFETAKIKVNDVEGNPIEIAAIVVWRVVDPAHALFSVESYSSFVAVQSESAVRNLATHHPYDGHDENLISLRGHTDAVAEEMQREIQNRC